MHIDTHIDLLFDMKKSFRKFSPQSETGHVDLLRARKGDLLAGFFAIFPAENNYYIDEGVRRWLDLVSNPDNHLKKITSYFDLQTLINERKSQKIFEEREIGAIMHIEGSAGIDTSLNRLYVFHECGLRSVGLTWNEANHFATGADGDPNRGLTSEGKNLISAINDLNMILDISHLNDKSFWDVMKYTNISILSSHSNLRKYADHKRNLTNEMVQEIAKSNGSIGINFCKRFLSTKEDHPPNRFCAMEMIREIINITGSTDHVHIGSDFDGCSIPDDVKDISTMSKFFVELKERLHLEKLDIEKIQYKNVERIIKTIFH
ncbi:MAG: hypothetical protein HeimC3_09040 [Candidatus Heimdallarchaeota archaeon LC_3]|nr:MAG: hypothetical protein HeimC3_09040 [Candidatus Heimdallarchaeota archaeon LC_3]